MKYILFVVIIFVLAVPAALAQNDCVYNCGGVTQNPDGGGGSAGECLHCVGDPQMYPMVTCSGPFNDTTDQFPLQTRVGGYDCIAHNTTNGGSCWINTTYGTCQWQGYYAVSWGGANPMYGAMVADFHDYMATILPDSALRLLVDAAGRTRSDREAYDVYRLVASVMLCPTDDLCVGGSGGFGGFIPDGVVIQTPTKHRTTLTASLN